MRYPWNCRGVSNIPAALSLILVVTVLAMFIGSCGGGGDDTGFVGEPDSAQIAGLRAELEERVVNDQKFRIMMDSVQEEFGADSEEMRELWTKQEAIDSANMVWLELTIKRFGWPRESMVGTGASTAAFLILQHADYWQQKRLLPALKEAVAGGEASPRHAAMLEDRILMREKKKQIYGTQLQADPHTGELQLYPIEDEINVDKRRAEIGLEPIADYVKHFGLDYTPPDTSAGSDSD